jgi:regulator of RNase E activity RraA/CMP-N-acetylneuraminic acid synthetase
MKVAAFVPAKGTSDRIENKNIKLLDGKPLFLHTVDKLLACSFIDEVVLDSESDDVIGLAGDRPCRILRRDPELASNKTDGNKLFLNQVRNTDAQIVIQVLGTSPFIEPATLQRGIDVLTNQPEYDSVVLVRRDKLYLWEDGQPRYDRLNIPNSSTLPETVIETMGLYMMRREDALRIGRRIGDRPYFLDASPLEAVDVNWQQDFELAELIAAGRREKERRLLSNLKGLLSSSMLSDILDDLGQGNQVIRNLSPNLADVKMLGRANTLRLRALREGEDFRGIYQALESYRTVIPNDIIMVENEVGQYAYFGELNANLAIRGGAAGVVVGGMTRDSGDVIKLGLPVFAKGYSCQDVRKRATVDTMGTRICIEGVEVRPEDLVFGDREGIVVIPRAVERQVIDAAFRVAANEKKILIDISVGADLAILTRDHGFF